MARDKLSEDFFVDSAIAKRLQSKSPSGRITKAEIKAFRISMCKIYADYESYPSDRIKYFCKREISHHSPNPAAKVNPPNQGPGNDVHSACLDARDYEGCVRVKSSGQPSRSSSDECDKASGICKVTSSDPDVYGLPRPMGWRYKQASDGRLFYFSLFYRIPHKGQEDRYIAFKRITRYYQGPRSGTAGTFIGGYSASTNCTSYGSGASCTTTGTSPSYIPGRRATAGGVVSSNFVTVYDCQDNTFASYENKKLGIVGWRKFEPYHYFPAILKYACSNAVVNRFPVLNLKM